MQACKKYPEGPTFSLRSPSQRIIGEWNLNYYNINGIDSLDKFLNYTVLPGMDLNDPGISDTAGYLIRGGVDTANYVSNIGLYELKNKNRIGFNKNKIVNYLNLTGPLMSSSSITYKILRLKKKNFGFRQIIMELIMNCITKKVNDYCAIISKCPFTNSSVESKGSIILYSCSFNQFNNKKAESPCFFNNSSSNSINNAG